ncbi:oligosaccharide flippase family protein [Frondihabitans cladoniiphilus]|uniref:O-antigen/teichoic acid export membrane protein n=1 Tax=Frondihabitans cladoniiphilus TaxID=715785 RepID=A0ABP8W667_9MICO
MTAVTAGEASHEEATDKASSRLFGRGLLYVVVLSLQLLVSTIVSPFLAHLVGPAEFGAMASAQAIFQVLSVAALLGLDDALVLQRAESAEKDDRSARGLVTVAILLAFAVTVVALVTLPLWVGPVGLTGNETLVAVVILWIGPSASVLVMLALLVAQDRLGAFVSISLVSAVAGSIVGIVLLVTTTHSIVAYAWGTVICQFVAMVMGIIVVRPTLAGFQQRDIIGRALRLGIPLVFTNLSYFVLNAGDRIILQRDLGSAQVGRYQVAYVIGSAVVLLLNYTTGAWAPQFAALRDPKARLELALRSRDELYRLLVPIIIAVTLVAPLALRILAPSTFQPQGLTFIVYLVSLTAFAVAAGGSIGRLLMVARRSKTIGINAAAAAVLNIVLNIVLVPPLGIAGSAVATLISFAVLAILGWVFLPQRKEWRRPNTRLLATIAGSIAIAGLSQLIPETEFWNIVKAVLAFACLPWFFVRLRAARTPSVPEAGDEVVENDELDAAASVSEVPASAVPSSAVPSSDVSTADASTAPTSPVAKTESTDL